MLTNEPLLQRMKERSVSVARCVSLSKEDSELVQRAQRATNESGASEASDISKVEVII